MVADIIMPIIGKVTGGLDFSSHFVTLGAVPATYTGSLSDYAALKKAGVPLLGSSLVSFECERESLHEAGDHFILVGRVVRAQFEPHRDPLLYFRGKYRRLHFA